VRPCDLAHKVIFQRVRNKPPDIEFIQ